MRCAFVAAALTVLCLAAMAQTPPPPKPSACAAAEHHQFDFWIGRWDVFTPDGKKAGINVIEAIDDGCVLLERWRGGGGFTGSSLNSWDAATRRWHQHWVDNQGGLLRLAGQWDGRRMVLAGTELGADGKSVLQRISWTPAADGSVRQLWEQSDDGGATWSVAFDGLYRRQ